MAMERGLRARRGSAEDHRMPLDSHIESPEPFSSDDLETIREELFAYLCNELHAPPAKAREWADRSASAMVASGRAAAPTSTAASR